MTARRPPPLGAVHRLAARPQWRAVEFISDLHLSEWQPRTFEAWVRYLRDTPADAVFILGDLFEVWIGDDARLPGSFAQRASEALAGAAARRPIAFMAGNKRMIDALAHIKTYLDYGTFMPLQYAAAWALEHGSPLEGLHVTQPTLEDVYLELTEGEAGRE